MTWLKLQKKFRNSVFQLHVVCATYNIERPCSTPLDYGTRGSGFLVDASKGIVITNAHVVENAISIVGRVPCLAGRDIQMRLISICREKDIAVCQILLDDLEMLMECHISEFAMGDSLLLEESDEVMSIGYPLGQESIKFTHGNVSGFQSSIDYGEFGDWEDSSTFVQITAPINKGNSGGPLINSRGDVVGICSAGFTEHQNVGYAIPSNTLLAIYEEMISPIKEEDIPPTVEELASSGRSFLIPLNGEELCYRDGSCVKTPYIFQTPKFGIEWCNTNDLMISEMFKGTKINDGVYVTSVSPDSIFCDSVKKGDLIYRIETDTKFHRKKISGEIDDYGFVDVRGIDRKLEIKDFIDSTIIGGKIKIWILRNENGETKSYHITSKFTPTGVYRNCFEYNHFKAMDYEFIAGMCIATISNNLALIQPQFIKYVSGNNKFRKFLYVAQLFAGTEASSIGAIQEGDVITKINGIEIENLHHLREIYRSSNDVITIENDKGGILFVTKSRSEKDNSMTKLAYSLK